MSGVEDDDLKFLRAAASRLSNLEKFLHRILQKSKRDPKRVRNRVRETDLFGVLALVRFQYRWNTVADLR